MNHQSAVVELLDGQLSKEGWTLQDLATQLSPSPRKTLRKLRQLWDGGSSSLQLLDLAAARLAVPKESVRAAQQQDLEQQHQEETKAIFDYHRQRFAPHLWIEMVKGQRWPAFINPDIYRRIDLPEDTSREAMSAFIRQLPYSGSLRVRTNQIESFLHRERFDLAHRFTPSGEFVETVEGEIVPVHYAGMRVRR